MPVQPPSPPHPEPGLSPWAEHHGPLREPTLYNIDTSLVRARDVAIDLPDIPASRWSDDLTPAPARQYLGLPIALLIVAAGFIGWGLTHPSPGAVTVDAAAAAQASASAGPPRLDGFGMPAVVAGVPDDIQATGVSLSSLENDAEVSGSPSYIGVYAPPPGKTAQLVLVGVPVRISDAGVAVDDTFRRLAADPQIDVGAPLAYDAGTLGGQMKCAAGTATEPGKKPAAFGVCVFADSGGQGMVVSYGHDAADTAKVALTARPAFESP